MSGRYAVLGHVAKGGMASVYLGRMSGSAGFSRLVAIKRLHPELAAERDFVTMLVDEARVASQIRHTNVIDTLDLVVSSGAFSLVLEYIDGDALSVLAGEAKQRGETVPRPIALAIMSGVLRGLDAAHEARSEDGHPLGVVHRDVSPQNVLVGIDGVARVIDFGVAKAVGRLESTRPGEIRGKLAYMAPEQIQGRPVTRQVDVYAAGVVLWELLTGERLFAGPDEASITTAIAKNTVPEPSSVNPDVPPELDAVVRKATSLDIGVRHLTARELLDDLAPFDRASDEEVGAWVRRLTVERRAARQKLIEGGGADAGIHSVEDVLKELEAPSAILSARPLTKEAAPAPKPAPFVAISFAAALVVVGLGALLFGSNEPAEPPPRVASSAPIAPPPPTTSAPAEASESPPLVAPVTTIESDPAPAKKTPPKKPSHAAPPAKPDPASFQ